MSNVYVVNENTDCITCARCCGVGECGVGFLLLFLNSGVDCMP